MIDYTILTVISIIALILSICCTISLVTIFKWSECVDDELECSHKYADTLANKIANQRADFNRSLFISERKEKELDERMNLLQQRLNLERMQNIIDGKIK